MLQRSAEPEGTVPRRQPIFNVPLPVLAVLALLGLVHLARQIIPDRWDDALFLHLAFVPGRFTLAFAPDRVMNALMALAERGGDSYRQAQAERFLLGDGSLLPWTPVTYALLHADWGHVGLNAVWLLAFGTPVARRLGGARFFALLTVSAAMGALVQYAAHPDDLAPVVGASAAVSGCMGATLRFMFQPHVPVAALIEAATGPGQAFVQPAQTLRGVLADRRALTFLLAWFATNLLFGVAPVSVGVGGPIAWEAHIGGFLAGLLLFRWFDPVRSAAPAPPVPEAPPEEA